MVAGPYGVGHYGYRTAFYGGHGGYYRPHYGYHRRHNVGSAVAAGLIGGLALGALAASPYGSSHPVSYGGYYGSGFYGGSVCYVTTRRGVDAWGRLVRFRTQVCE
jgi:hypothetical protein